jgi:hypothetical protein
MRRDPDDTKNQGPTFSAIPAGDVILIARRFQNRPQVVGFGVVNGRAKRMWFE